jgi:hypothetical protein
MKKIYENPTLSKVSLNSSDVIKTSGEAPVNPPKNDYSGEWDSEM